jgi:hypothetical protein
MTKLNQIIAVLKGVKASTNREITDVYKALQRTDPMKGITRTYRPKHEDGDQLPSESTKVQVKVDELLAQASDVVVRLFDITLTQEVANAKAKANVSVDGKTILSNVPVTYLLFLEKQLTDLGTLVGKIPTLDPAEEWVYDSNIGAWKTNTVETVRTKKIPRNHVKAEATDKHPAQVEVYNEDVLVGYWSTTKLSGALPADRVAELAKRIELLKEAVKFAREEANGTEVEQQKAGQAVINFLFK